MNGCELIYFCILRNFFLPLCNFLNSRTFSELVDPFDHQFTLILIMDALSARFFQINVFNFSSDLFNNDKGFLT